MSSAHSWVTYETTGSIQGHDLPMTFIYHAAEPMAVLLRLDPEDTTKDWMLARSAFTEAMAFRPLLKTAAHDVHVRRTGEMGELIVIELMPNNPSRAATIHLSTDDVRAFLVASHTVVPIGAQPEREALDWAAAEQILGLTPGQLTEPRTR